MEKQQSLELGVTSKQVHIKIIKKIIKSVGMSALCKHCTTLWKWTLDGGPEFGTMKNYKW